MAERDKNRELKQGIFDIELQGNNDPGEEVSEAAELLKKFVSKVEPQTEDLNPFSSEGEESELEKIGSSVPHSAEVSSSKLDLYLEKARQLSEQLKDGEPLITPRLFVPGKVGAKVPSIKLRYKGKATKKQLERIKKRLERSKEG